METPLGHQAPATSLAAQDSVVTTQLRREQRFVDKAYRLLDQQRDFYRREQAKVAAEISANPSARADRDALAAHYGDTAARLESVENRLVFGHLLMDHPDGTVSSYHIGRIGLREDTDATTRHLLPPSSLDSVAYPMTQSSADTPSLNEETDSLSHQVLVDWRAPAAKPFYQATALRRMEVRKRRHITTELRRVVAVEDELLDVNRDIDPQTLQGEGALLAALSRARSGHMSDIVSTIQAEQDRVIRSDLSAFLVVQGGPGTGKTAVALHRAAYLLYSHRSLLDTKGVLVVGPSKVFLRYIERVLPALGETGVVNMTLREAFPGISAGAEDPALVDLKGDMRWLAVCKTAVADLCRPPDSDQSLHLDHVQLLLTAQQVREAMEAATRSSNTHNQRWQVYARILVRALTKLYAGENANTEDEGWMTEEVRSSPQVRRAINLMYLPSSAPQLLERLYAHPSYLRRIAIRSGQVFTNEELAALYRPAGSVFTEGDVPILDELAELLGPLPSLTDAAAAAQARENREIAAAAEAIAAMELGGGMVSARTLAAQSRGQHDLSPLAQRARADRTWVYGHVVVDEAQELTPMQWHLLLRRCPSRSFTVVGDVNQTSRAGHATWKKLLGPATRVQPLLEALTINYRTPGTLMRIAQRVLEAAGEALPVAITSAREVEDCYQVTWVSDTVLPTGSVLPTSAVSDTGGIPDALAATVQHVVAEEKTRLETQAGAGGGKLAVISPLGGSFGKALGLAEKDPIEDQCSYLDPQSAKGLEFDVVVLVEPSLIAANSMGDLYVALTRPTQRLHVVTTTNLPAGM